MSPAAPVSEDLMASSKVLKNAPFTPFDKPRTGFDRLRANGGELVNIEALPFVSCFSPT